VFAQATATAFEIYLNAVAVSVSLVGTYPTQIFQSTANFFIGDRTALDTPFGGLADDLRVYRRAMSIPEIRLLATEPGVGLKPERASVFFGAQLFNAAWAKNSNQLISAGVL
jgi:hypothetical protein